MRQTCIYCFWVTIHNLIRQYNQTGNTIDTPRSGQPKATMPRQDRIITHTFTPAAPAGNCNCKMPLRFKESQTAFETQCFVFDFGF